MVLSLAKVLTHRLHSRSLSSYLILFLLVDILERKLSMMHSVGLIFRRATGLLRCKWEFCVLLIWKKWKETRWNMCYHVGWSYIPKQELCLKTQKNSATVLVFACISGVLTANIIQLLAMFTLICLWSTLFSLFSLPVCNGSVTDFHLY